jgi:PAS domain S-box-containing protein
MHEANEFGKQVVAGAQAGIIVYDREGKCVVWNPFMEQITGYNSREVTDRRALDVFPFLREQQFERMFKRALDGETFEAADMWFDLPGKRRRCWTASRFAPWRDATGDIVGVIVAVRDITERRRLEAELLEISVF